jgi:hypothetical protein
MKKFLLLDSTQGAMNVLLGCWVILGMMIMFMSESSTFESMIWCPISVLCSIILFLVYNVWVSMALNE